MSNGGVGGLAIVVVFAAVVVFLMLWFEDEGHVPFGDAGGWRKSAQYGVCVCLGWRLLVGLV